MRPNNGMQRTALPAAADAKRSARFRLGISFRDNDRFDPRTGPGSAHEGRSVARARGRVYHRPVTSVLTGCLNSGAHTTRIVASFAGSIPCQFSHRKGGSDRCSCFQVERHLLRLLERFWGLKAPFLWGVRRRNTRSRGVRRLWSAIHLFHPAELFRFSQ